MTEKLIRQSQVDLTALTATITAEATARQTADTQLQTQITSNATQIAANTSAFANYIPLTQKAAANGVAGLDANGKISASAIPYATASTVGGVKISFDSTTSTLAFITEE